MTLFSMKSFAQDSYLGRSGFLAPPVPFNSQGAPRLPQPTPDQVLVYPGGRPAPLNANPSGQPSYAPRPVQRAEPPPFQRAQPIIETPRERPPRRVLESPAPAATPQPSPSLVARPNLPRRSAPTQETAAPKPENGTSSTTEAVRGSRPGSPPPPAQQATLTPRPAAIPEMPLSEAEIVRRMQTAPQGPQPYAAFIPVIDRSNATFSKFNRTTREAFLNMLKGLKNVRLKGVILSPRGNDDLETHYAPTTYDWMQPREQDPYFQDWNRFIEKNGVNPPEIFEGVQSEWFLELLVPRFLVTFWEILQRRVADSSRTNNPILLMNQTDPDSHWRNWSRVFNPNSPEVRVPRRAESLLQTESTDLTLQSFIHFLKLDRPAIREIIQGATKVIFLIFTARDMRLGAYIPERDASSKDYFEHRLEEMLNELRALSDDPEKFIFSTIAIDPNEDLQNPESCLSRMNSTGWRNIRTNGLPSVQRPVPAKMLKSMSHTFQSICDENYAPTTQRIRDIVIRATTPAPSQQPHRRPPPATATRPPAGGAASGTAVTTVRPVI